MLQQTAETSHLQVLAVDGTPSVQPAPKMAEAQLDMSTFFGRDLDRKAALRTPSVACSEGWDDTHTSCWIDLSVPQGDVWDGGWRPAGDFHVPLSDGTILSVELRNEDPNASPWLNVQLLLTEGCPFPDPSLPPLVGFQLGAVTLQTRDLRTYTFRITPLAS